MEWARPTEVKDNTFMLTSLSSTLWSGRFTEEKTFWSERELNVTRMNKQEINCFPSVSLVQSVYDYDALFSSVTFCPQD